MDHVRPDNLDLPVRYYRQRRGARIGARLLAQGVVLVAVLASGWWGVHTLDAHTLASEEGPSVAWLHPVRVGGCPVGGTGLDAKGSTKEGCSVDGLSHPISSRRPGAGLVGKHTQGSER
jgi:hypothetical protein